MSSTPESKTISMVVKEWQGDCTQQDGPIHRISGFPWYLDFYKSPNTVYLNCTKSKESALWQCTVNIKTMDNENVVHTFSSWGSNYFKVSTAKQPVGTVLKVEVITDDDGESWRRRFSVDPLEPRDGILVIGEDKKKVYVNKQALSLSSPFFDKLFNSDFKEKNLEEIPIGDVDYEEFCNIIRLAHGFTGYQLNDDNVRRVLQLADRFELKIVEDKVISYLLGSTISSFTILQKLLISEQYNLAFLKDILLSKDYTNDELKAFCTEDEMKQLSAETLFILYEKAAKKLPKSPKSP